MTRTWATSGGARVHEVLHGRCNCYLVVGNGTSLLVDTGRCRNVAALQAGLAQAGVAPEQPLLVVLTHTHFDHAENAAQVRATYDATLFVHRSEAGYLAMGDSPLPAGSVLPTRLLSRAVSGWMQRRVRYAPTEADELVDERLDFRSRGVPAYLLHTPGHSKGSLSVIVDNEVGLVGDAMVGIVPGATFPPYADDPNRLMTSWQALLATGCSRFLPAHGSERGRSQLARSLARRCPRAPVPIGPRRD